MRNVKTYNNKVQSLSALTQSHNRFAARSLPCR